MVASDRSCSSTIAAPGAGNAEVLEGLGPARRCRCRTPARRLNLAEPLLVGLLARRLAPGRVALEDGGRFMGRFPAARARGAR
jgi:hypothetical protein